MWSEVSHQVCWFCGFFGVILVYIHVRHCLRPVTNYKAIRIYWLPLLGLGACLEDKLHTEFGFH